MIVISEYTPKIPFCIICEKTFSSMVKPSKEHIIPAALGNEALVTYSVCEKCNNDLGRNVDCHLTDFIAVKIHRKQTLEKDRDLRILDPVVTEDNGHRLKLGDNGMELLPSIVDTDEKKGRITIEAASLEEGIKFAEKTLMRKYNMSSEKAKKTIRDSMFTATREQLISCEGIYSKCYDINMFLLMLAVAKIAYEYASEKLGKDYLSDNYAIVLRRLINAGRKGEKTCSREDRDLVSDLFDLMNIEQGIENYISIYRNEGRLFCIMKLLGSNLPRVRVLLSVNAERYPLKENEKITDVW